MPDILIPCLLLGAFAGILSGLLGIGGGSVIVPALLLLFDWYQLVEDRQMLIAVATSLATIIPTSVASVYTHHKLGAVQWPWVYRLVPGILLGTVLGSVVAERLPNPVLSMIFAVFLLLVSLQMAFALRPKADGPTPSATTLSGFGLIIGVLSALLGIGGGTISVPFLVRHQVPIRHAVAISSACGCPIAVAGTLSYWFLGLDQGALADGMLGYIYMPAWLGIVLCSVCFAPLGARWAHRLPTQQLKRVFAVFLFLTGSKLLSSAVLS